MHWRTSLFILFLISSTDAAHVVTRSGRQITGVNISAIEDGSVTLTTASGQILTFRKEQYRTASADRPKQLEQADNRFKEGETDEAVALLNQVKVDCRFLKWDQTAILLLANHYYDSGQFSEAASEFEVLENLDDPGLQTRYRDALLKSGNPEQIFPVLENDIATGSREVAAQAYLLRGDLKAAKGDLLGARRDWFKVTTFFKTQKESVKNAEERILNSEGVEK